MKEWQFNVLFFVGIGGALTLLVGPGLGLKIDQNPTTVAGIGAILSYVLTQKKKLTKDDDEEKHKKPPAPSTKPIRLIDLDQTEIDAEIGRVLREKLQDRLEEGEDK